MFCSSIVNTARYTRAFLNACVCVFVCVERCCCGRKRSRICIAKFRSQSGVGWAPPHIHVENSRTRIRVECTQISYTHTRTDRCECAPVCDTTLDRYPGTLLQPAERYFSGHVPGNLRSSCKVIRFFFEIWRETILKIVVIYWIWGIISLNWKRGNWKEN